MTEDDIPEKNSQEALVPKDFFFETMVIFLSTVQSLDGFFATSS